MAGDGAGGAGTGPRRTFTTRRCLMVSSSAFCQVPCSSTCRACRTGACTALCHEKLPQAGNILKLHPPTSTSGGLRWQYELAAVPLHLTQKRRPWSAACRWTASWLQGSSGQWGASTFWPLWQRQQLQVDAQSLLAAGNLVRNGCATVHTGNARAGGHFCADAQQCRNGRPQTAMLREA